MVADASSGGSRDAQKSLSRESAESLCLLHAVGDGCMPAQLMLRLGLAPSLASSVMGALAPLIAQGLLESRGEQVVITSSGQAWRDAPTGASE